MNISRQITGLIVWAALALPLAANAEEDGPEVVIVPFAPANLVLPHPAHEDAPVALKAILRGATCAAGYRVRWDTNFNGAFDEDEELPGDYKPIHGTNTVYDIGRTFVVPTVSQDRTIPINVRVQSRCDDSVLAHGTFRLFVYDWAPSEDPTLWSEDDRDVMNQMAIQESMWWLHRKLYGYDGSDNQISALVYHRDSTSHRLTATAAMIWVMSLNGHHPAYPPDTMNWFSMEPDEVFNNQNSERWNADPYAESMMRGINGITRSTGQSGRAYTFAIDAADEANTCGLEPDGSERVCDPIDGTDDGLGIAMGRTGVYVAGKLLGALSTVLPILHNTPVQLGPVEIVGKPWTWMLQQMTDYLVWMQFDRGCNKGAWYYHGTEHYVPALDDACLYADASATQWALIGLEGADVVGRDYGLIVNNRAKYRVANHLMVNQAADGGAKYRSDLTDYEDPHEVVVQDSNFQVTGGAFVGARWLGIQHMDPFDDAVPFSNGADYDYSSYSAGELRRAYDNYLAFTAALWEDSSHVGSLGWVSRLWVNGDYLCNEPQGVYNVSQMGNTYAMYSHQKGYRTGDPELDRIGEHDWNRQFTIYYIRAQSRETNRYDLFGRVVDRYCGTRSVTCLYARSVLTTGWASLAMTPSIFRPKPVAVPMARPRTVAEGCAGGNAGRVRFQHWQTFHPKANAQIIKYDWDADDSNGLWWETGADPDFTTGDPFDSFEYSYTRAGFATATLRVLDDGEPQEEDTSRIQITIEEAPPFPPAANAGGPYAIEAGDDLHLRGVASDPNEACGDEITVDWDLNGDNNFVDAFGAETVVPWNQIQGLSGSGISIRMRVRDTQGHMETADAVLTIYAREPIAVPLVQPNPAACGQEIVFNAAASHHQSPHRSVVHYRWELDGDPPVTAAGPDPLFRHIYDAFGNYDAELIVTDDLGREGKAEFIVEIDQGNIPPVARTAQVNFTVVEHSDVVLDGRPSSDDDVPCGDSIVQYDWDINGNGSFDDAGIDRAGPNPIVPWAVLESLGWTPDQPEPLVLACTLRVTDSVGAQGTTDFTITLVNDEPVVIVHQRPDPALFYQQSGFVSLRLNAAASYTLVPGEEIVAYQWQILGYHLGPRETESSSYTIRRRLGPSLMLPEIIVRVTAIDSTGRSGSTDYRLNLGFPGQTPPSADADPAPHPEPGYHILEGEDLTLDGSASGDPDRVIRDYIAAYRWDVDADGAYDSERNYDRDDHHDDWEDGEAPWLLVLSQEEQLDYGMGVPGTYTVTLEVEDSTELKNTDIAPVVVHPVPPVAIFTANPNPAACGAEVTFDARASHHSHPDIDIRNHGYRWDLDGDLDFDDGPHNAVVAHDYEEFTFDGPIRVGLQVTDSEGNRGTVFTDVEVNLANQAPVARPGGPYVEIFGREASVSFDGRPSNDPDVDCGDEIVSYAWDLHGDGSIEHLGPEYQLDYDDMLLNNILASGDYPVILRVTDRFGAVGESMTVLRLLSGPTAVPQAEPNNVGCEEPVTFDGTASFTDTGEPVLRWQWDLDGDGLFEHDAPQVTANVIGDGQAEITLKVTDSLDRTDTRSIIVLINFVNLPPTADAGGPYVSGVVNRLFQPITLDGRASFDPNEPCDGIAHYWWDTDGDGLYGEDDADGAGGMANQDYVGAVVPGYVNPLWAVNTTQVVRLITIDRAGNRSAPSDAEIELTGSAPPAGELLAPRGGGDLCIAADPFEIEFLVSDPEGDVVTVSVLIGGHVVGTADVNTPEDGDPINATIVVDPEDVQEGDRNIELVLDDGGLTHPRVNAGGAILFDRTPPEVVIGHELGADVCYEADEVPEPVITVRDAFDNAPIWNHDTKRTGCGEALTVVAKDSCGNERIEERAYRVGVPLHATINAPPDGALVTDARVTWDTLENPVCRNQITATSSTDGDPAVPYPPNTLLDEPGRQLITIDIPDCTGRVTTYVRNFIVNAPPILEAGGPYAADEGDPLTLDARGTIAPEPMDDVELYEWDFDGDGVFETQGALVAYDTSQDGRFDVTLRVTDSLGATSTDVVQIDIADRDPVAVITGNYEGSQGQAIVFDGTASDAGHPSDPITNYRWDWGDDSPPTEGPLESMPSHEYLTDGIFEVTLTVFDEDSSDVHRIEVVIEDVDPRLTELHTPIEIYEIAPMEFMVEAEPGADDEPIIGFEWRWGDDSGPTLTDDPVATHSFREAGLYNVRVRANDGDSSEGAIFQVHVRPITFAELIEVTTYRLADARPVVDPDAPQGGVPEDFENVDQWLARAAWGEAHGRRGNTLVAIEHIIDGIAMLQFLGNDLGNTLWAVSRQLWREIDGLRAEITDPEHGVIAPDDEDPANAHLLEYLARADGNLASARAIFEDPDFEDDVSGDNDPFRANDLFAEAFEAYFYLTEVTSPCNNPAYGRFPVFDDIDADDIDAQEAGIYFDLERANATNDQLDEAFGIMAAELGEYVAEGDDAPGRDEARTATLDLGVIRTFVQQDVGIDCEENPCISDGDALDMELQMMELASNLFASNSMGVWVRNWQACLVQGIKFRIELSIRRVAAVCGPDYANEFTARARLAQQDGLRYVDQDFDIPGGLHHYIDRDTRCLMIEIFNECIAARVEQAHPREFPEYCENQFD